MNPRMPETPIKLTVVVPMVGEQPPFMLNDPAGYEVQNMTLAGLAVTHEPIRDIARALEGDGYSPYVNFALLNQAGETLYIGPVGQRG